MQVVSCPHCASHVTNDGTFCGQVVSCPSCQGQFQMPVGTQHLGSETEFDTLLDSPTIPNTRSRRSTTSRVLLVLGALVGVLSLCVLSASIIWFAEPSDNDEVEAAKTDALKKARAYDECKSSFLAEYEMTFSGKIGKVNEVPTEALVKLKQKALALDQSLEEAIKAVNLRMSTSPSPVDESEVTPFWRNEKVKTLAYIHELELYLKDRELAKD